MNVAWIIIDSLSFSATPFADDGPETMPRLADLAADHGLVFTNAYVPGVFSASSHGSFFTGELPSTTGMHAVSPKYSHRTDTIAERLSDTHDSMLISANPFLFDGLDRGFDEVDDLRKHGYLRYPNACDPAEFGDPDQSTVSSYLLFAKASVKSGTPIRSMVNGLEFLRSSKTGAAIPETSPDDDETYQYANTMNRRIKRFVAERSPFLIVANYMDVHAPLDASDEALERFAPVRSRSALPIGEKGQAVWQRIQTEEGYDGSDMYDLYKAAICDIDRKVTPLIEHLLYRETFVVVTADHGNWFRRETEVDEERIHVPLLILSPDQRGETVDTTINLRSLPKTTVGAVGGDPSDILGDDLLSPNPDHVSITEHIKDRSVEGTPVDPLDSDTGDLLYQVVGVSGGARVDLYQPIDETGDPTAHPEYTNSYGDEPRLSTIREEIELLNEKTINMGDGTSVEFDDETQRRLEDLGYIQ